MLRIERKRSLLLCLVGALALAVAVLIFTLPHAEATEDYISQTLERLGASGCTYLGESPTISEGKTLYLHYFDEASQTDYFFEGDNGYLHSVTHFSVLDAPSKATRLSDEERDAAVLSYVQSCIAPAQIGDLKITASYYDNMGSYSYTLTEFYQEQETGTVAYVSVTDRAEIIFCSIIYGEVFCTEPAPVIGETAAIEAAQVCTRELAAERSLNLTGEPTCTLKALGASRFYLVKINTVFADDEEQIITAIIQVDACSGEILQVAWS